MPSLRKRHEYISDRITSRTSRVLTNRMPTRVHVGQIKRRLTLYIKKLQTVYLMFYMRWCENSKSQKV